jgi:hypothetical protein
VVDRQISSALICFGVFKLPLPAEGDEGAMPVEFISLYSPIIFVAFEEAPSLVGFARVVGDGERLANSTLPSGDPIAQVDI